MKRVFKTILFTILMFSFSNIVYADSLSIWSNMSSVKVGQTVTISVGISGYAGTFDVTNSNQAVLSGSGASGEWMEDNTYTFTYTAKSVGSSTITVKAVDVSTSDEKTFTGSKSITINVVAATSSGSTSGGSTSEKKTYSSDNTLSGLSVDGYDIIPKFSKDTLEYTLEVDETVEKIKVNATANDKNASVSGAGEKALTSGENTIEIKVTAENGNEKVYKIIVTVKDQNPITITIDNKEYTVVKKNHDIIEIPEYYEESTIKIDNQDVVCYKNEKSNITLIILKDEDNKVGYYIYDEKNKTYEIYNTIKIGNITLSILDMDSKLLPIGYKKYTLEIEDTKIEGYKLDKDSNFYLTYALNVENGEKSLYLYDKKENTIGRYDEDIPEYYSSKSEETSKKYKLYFCVSLSALLAVTIVLIVVLVKKHKGKRRKNKVKL